jgi:hypothetical protein
MAQYAGISALGKIDAPSRVKEPQCGRDKESRFSLIVLYKIAANRIEYHVLTV